jgi:hypothetical protein
MSQIGELFSRILSAGGSRGLSRDADLVLAPDPALAFFNESLRRHHADGDIVGDPGLLWDTGALLGRREGLKAHLLADRGSGVLGVSDVLVIVNRDDWRRSFREVRVPWVERASELMRERFDAFCREEDFHLAFPQRPLGFRIVEDGGAEMRGERIGLGAGELVTGLLPNLYGGAVRASRRSIAVHLHVPGGWDGYQEVGALHSDQVLFTLGSHWLDNYRHPALEVPALYRLHQYGDGSFVHVINPEVKDRYRITERAVEAGPEVLRIERDDGVMIAWMVLQVVEEEGPPSTVPPRRWSSTMQELGADETFSVDGDPLPGPMITSGRTVVPEAMDDRLVSMRETGALLQKVHFARFMEGYDVYLDEEGRVVTDAARPAATLHVRGRQVSMEAHQGGVGLDGVALSPGAPVFLEGDARITVGETAIEWVDLGGIRARGWPYLGELRRVGTTSHLVHGRTHRIGREPRCAVRLPDEPHNDNIVWRPELRAGGTIRSRNGEIPKSRFYIDSIMVASEHAEVDLSDQPRLRSLARDCYSYVRRGAEILPLHPRRKQDGPMERTLAPGDEILVGNCVFRIGWGETRSPEAAPRLTAQELADAVDVTVRAAAPPAPKIAAPMLPEPAPVVVQEEATGAFVPGSLADEQELEPALLPEPASGPFDLPVAAGLGERGSAPPPLRFGQGADSLMGRTSDTFDALDVPTTPATSREQLGLAPIAPTPGRAFDALDAPTRPSTLRSDVLDAPTRPGVSTADITRSVELPRVAAPMLTGDADSFSPELDPTAVPVGEQPPPVAIPASGDSLLGDRDDPMPTPAPAVRAAPDAPPADPTGVAVVDESDWQHELSRPARLALVGWMVTGTVVVGNHAGADVVVPENRSAPGQAFRPTDYLELYVRGRRGRFRVLSTAESSVRLGGAAASEGDQVDGLEVSVIRRDDQGEPDFDVELALVEDPGLPDPRARLLRLDRSDRMASALFTLGLPLRQPRPVQLGAIAARATWDGQGLSLEGYLPTYRRSDGTWRPFFVRSAGAAFRTVPEDGAPLVLRPGDQLISGRSVYVFEG